MTKYEKYVIEKVLKFKHQPYKTGNAGSHTVTKPNYEHKFQQPTAALPNFIEVIRSLGRLPVIDVNC